MNTITPKDKETFVNGIEIYVNDNVDVIWPFGHRAEIYEKQFKEARGQTFNLLVLEFTEAYGNKRTREIEGGPLLEFVSNNME